MKMGLGIVMLVVVAGTLLAGFMLPKHVVVGRRVVIDAPPELVWPDVGSLATWPDWTEWSPKNDPAYDPKPEGTNKLTWTQSQSGAGSQVITEGDPAKGIKYKLELQGGRYVVDGRVQFTRDGTRTAVAWVSSMDYAHSYTGRYFGAAMDLVLGPMIEKSLLSLKSRSEERAKAKGVVAVSAPPVHDAALTPPPEEKPVEVKPPAPVVEEKEEKPAPAPAPPPVVEEKPAPVEAKSPPPPPVAEEPKEEPKPAEEPKPEEAPAQP